MALLKQSTAYTRMFLLVQSADHVSGLTSASPTVTISKAGGAFGAAGGTVTEVANGFYKVALTTTDTNTLGDLAYHITAASGDPSDLVDQIIAVDLADATALGLSRLDAAVTTRSSHTAADIWAVGTRALTDKAGFALSSAGVQAIWDALTSALTTTGSIGKRLADDIDATISSRSSHTAADVWTATTRTLSAFAFSVTVGTNNDKTGYALSAAGVQAIWDALTSALTTAGSIGKLLVDNVNATISSRSTLDAPGVWAAATRTLSAFAFSVTVGTNNDKTGYGLSAAAVQAVWDALTSALTTAGSIGKRLADDVDATISSRLATGSYVAPDNSSITTILGRTDVATSTRLATAGYTAPDNADVVAIKAKTDNLPAAPAAVSDIPTAAAVAAAVWAAGSRTLTSFGTLASDVWAVATRTLTSAAAPSAAAISTQVWSEALPGSFAAGSAGFKVNALGAAADPLAILVPGSYASGTAGAALGRIGSAQVSTVAPVSADGATVTIVRGDDYLAADGRALDFVDVSAQWPTLTSAAIAFTVRRSSSSLAVTGSVVTATGPNKTVRAELTSAQTTALGAGPWDFDVQATLSGGHILTLVRGTLTVLADQTHA